MAKSKKKEDKKPTKKRENKYEEKLKINGSFEDLVKALANSKEQPKNKDI